MTQPRRRGPQVVPDAPRPQGLSEESAGLWEQVVETWHLGPLELELLRAALEQLDVYREATQAVRKEGPTYTNPSSGHVRPHPALAAAHASLRAYRQALKALALPDPGRR